MTDRELMQEALDALEEYCEHNVMLRPIERRDALRARLEQPEPEPITMVVSKTGDPSVTMSWWHEPALPVGTPLYTAPPQREWVGLTNEDMNKLRHLVDWTVPLDIKKFARAIEAKLKEKNT